MESIKIFVNTDNALYKIILLIMVLVVIFDEHF